MRTGRVGHGGRTGRPVAILALLLGLALTGCASPTGSPAASVAIVSASPSASPGLASPDGSSAAPSASPGAPGSASASPGPSAAAFASAGASASADASASPAPSPSPSPIVGYTGGTATATITLPSGTLPYAGGSCEHGSADAWLAVNIGQPNGPEYFGLVAGRSPYGPTDLQVAAGGGTLKGDAVLVTYLHAGAPFVLDHNSATVILVTDLSGGTFSGHLADGTQVRGSFSC
jgi:hypothetical protein